MNYTTVILKSCLISTQTLFCISDKVALQKCLKGKTLFEKDDVGATQLYWRAREGDYDCTQIILQEARRTSNVKKLVNTAHEEGDTPLYASSFNGHTKLVEVLVSNGANTEIETNEKSTTPGTTALIVACEKGHVEIVNILIRYGADVKKQKEDGADCAYIAAQFNQLKILKLILPGNPELTERHLFKGLTILHTAAWENHYDVAKYIIQESNGSTFNNKQNDYQDTPLGIAIQTEGDLKMVRLLVENGAKTHLRSDNKTPLEWAKEKKKQAIIDYLDTL